jgi:hypothetical protein
MSPGDARCRPAATSGTGTATDALRISGRVSLNLMCPFAEAMGRAGEVESLPDGITVILRVTGTPDPAVLDRLVTFGPHVRYEVHGRDGHCTGAWVRALRDGSRRCA